MSGLVSHDAIKAATSGNKTDMEVAEYGQTFLNTLNPVRYGNNAPMEATSPGGISKKRKTTAQEIQEKLTDQDRALLEGVIGSNLKFIPPSTLDRIGSMFNILDTSRDGKLQAEDFTHNLPRQNAMLLSFWESLQDACDFDGDGEVDQQEFIGFFVFHAMEDQCALPDNKQLHVGGMLEHAINHFVTSLNNKVEFIEAQLADL